MITSAYLDNSTLTHDPIVIYNSWKISFKNDSRFLLIIKGEDIVLPLCPTCFVPRGTFLGLPPLLKSGGLSQGVASRYGSDVL